MKTGTESSLPKWDLFDSVAFVTGGKYRPPRSDQWQDTSCWLQEEGFSGMEYVAYIMYYSECRYDRAAALYKANWVCCEATRSAFLEWKHKRGKEVKSTAFRQTRSFHDFMESGYSLRRTLLENLAEVSAPVLAELAFRYRAQGPDIFREAMEKCADAAYLWILGCPEYLRYCPRIQTDLEKGEESELRRTIVEAGGITSPAALPGPA